MNVERGLDAVISGVGCRILGEFPARHLASAGAQAVDRDAPGQLGDPRADRVVVAQRVQVGVRPREDLLEDVLGVLFR